ncbi:MAG: D-amino acid aminotransferase [Gammaproteobacteria bacterium]|jgi:D-alanine transaminase|nr:D-amino acid aminotransferase [Gammaproteobacteria bacterium]
MSTVYLNGDFLPEEDACVSVLDRGFIFGDGVYEVIPAYGRRPFRLQGHLARLQDSLDGVRIPNPHTAEQWQYLIEKIIDANEGEDQSVYLQITRGAAKRDHAFPSNATPTVLIMSSPLSGAGAELLKSGVAAITTEDIRWVYCHIKAICLLPNVLLRQKAIDAQSAEAILIRDGLATEGAASNLFIVHDGIIRTPSKGPLLLPGITRDLVIELAAQNHIPYEEANILEADLTRADEIWLTSSTKEILAVTHLNGTPVGNGKPGPLWERMYGLYQQYKQLLREGKM